ncbi:hypothetical protein [Massilia haematophila]|uniref:Uncharacterized protein n=1 Tax=Massilia haematophila TaxID=457923 RepID=A0ABV7PI40_9BURK
MLFPLLLAGGCGGGGGDGNGAQGSAPAKVEAAPTPQAGSSVAVVVTRNDQTLRLAPQPDIAFSAPDANPD